MKQLFFLFIMIMSGYLMAGREIVTDDLDKKLCEMKCAIMQIRTQLGYGVHAEDVVPISRHEREMHYCKFYTLWSEFKEEKETLQKNFSDTRARRTQFVVFVLELTLDKKRYDKEIERGLEIDMRSLSVDEIVDSQ